jgi:TBP-interacting protein
MQQNIAQGSVVQIDAESGRITNVGLSLESNKGKTLDVDTSRKVPQPSGDALKDKEFVYTLTLADMDEIKRETGLEAAFFPC